MSALPPKADIRRDNPDVRFVPKADINGSVGQNDAWHLARGISSEPMRLED